MIPAIHWPTTAAIIIAGGIATQAFGLTPRAQSWPPPAWE